MSRETELLQYCDTANVGPLGCRVRHRRHPELKGRLKAYEWNKPGVLSAIPYLIAWDDSGLAHEMLGMFFVYASDANVEQIEEDE